MENSISEKDTLMVDEIFQKLENNPSFTRVFRDWQTFARALGINEVNVLDIEGKILFQTLVPPDAPKEIMKLWMAEKGFAANLNVLCEALISECGLQERSESLALEFITKRFKQNMQVIFQGNTKTLYEILPKKAKYQSRESITRQLTLHPLNAPIQVFHEGFSPTEPPTYYVSRTLRCWNELDERIFKDYSLEDDIFLLKGITPFELGPKVQFRPIEYIGNQEKKITAQFILTEHDQSYDWIVKKTEKAVHVIHFRKNRFFWIKSSHKIREIEKFIQTEDQTEIKILEKIMSAQSPLIFIAGSAGIGKSFLVRNLAYKVKFLNPTAIVLCVSFKKLMEGVVYFDTVFNVLAMYVCPHALSRNIFQKLLRSATLYLFLDGYDEIIPKEQKMADKFLKRLKRRKNSKVIVAVKPHLKSQIEEDFNQLSFELLPFTEFEQVEFLTSYWIHQHEATEGQMLQHFSELCLKSFGRAVADRRREFAAITLHCMKIAEVFAKDAKKASTMDELPDFVVDPSSIFLLCKSLFDIKFANDFLSETSTNGQETYIKAHVYASISMLFPDWSEEFKTCLKGYDQINESTLYSVGLLEKIDKAILPKFIHQTLAEYALAIFLVPNLGKYRTCLELLYEELLGKNAVSSKEEIDGLRSYELKHSLIVHFMDLRMQSEELALYEPLINSHVSNINPEDVCIALSVSFKYGFENLFDLTRMIISQIKLRINRDLMELYFRSMPHIAVLYAKSVPLFKKLLKLTKDEFGVNLSYHTHISKLSNVPQTIVHFTLMNFNDKVFKTLFRYFGKEIATMQGVLHACVNNSGRNSSFVIQEKLEVIDMLLHLQPSWLKENLESGRVPILTDNIHVRLFLCLLENGENVNTLSSTYGTVLHTASENGIQSNYRNVLREALNKGFRLINQRRKNGQTPIMTAIVNLKYLNDDVLQLFHASGADFKAHDDDGLSVLHLAIQCSNTIDFVRKIIDFGANVTQIDKWKNNAAHIIVNHVKEESQAVALVELLQSRRFNAFDQKNKDHFTPLQLARRERPDDTELIEWLTQSEIESNNRGDIGQRELSNEQELTSKEQPHVPTKSSQESAESTKASTDLEANKPKVIYHDKIECSYKEKIGHGATSTVYKGTFGTRRVAVKVIPCVNEEQALAVENEMLIFTDRDNHENIAKCYAHERIEAMGIISYRIATELCNISLKDWIENNKASREKLGKFGHIRSLEILYQITKGLFHLHYGKKCVIHRDLKPDNILLLSRDGQIIIKLTDFGISNVISTDKTHHTTRFGAGTTDWLAPELAEVGFISNSSAKVTTRTDIYSLGLIYYYVLSNGKNPATCGIVPLDLTDGTSYYNYIRLIRLMISKEQEQRPTTADIINHHIFWDYEKKLFYLTELWDYGGKAELKKLEEWVKQNHTKLADSSHSNFEKIFSADEIFGHGWVTCISDSVLEGLKNQNDKRSGKKSYNGKSLLELLRSIRNLKAHFREKSKPIQDEVGQPPKEFFKYWHASSRFPYLLDAVWTAYQEVRGSSNTSNLQKYYHAVSYEFYKC